MENNLENIAKEFYSDKSFFDNDRSFAEKHFCEGAQFVLDKAKEWFTYYINIHQNVETDENGVPLASSYIEYAKKRLEEVELLTKNFTEFVTSK